MPFHSRFRAALLAAAVAFAPAVPLYAQGDAAPAPNRAEGDGPFDRLIIRGAIMIDGTGAPPRGPVDIVVERNRITEIVNIGSPGMPINEARRPKGATREIDATGMYVMPGFIDLHVHTGGRPKAPEAEYVYKLWLAHGVTTVRGVPFGSMEWGLSEKARSARNEITAPRMFSCHRPGQGAGWKGGAIRTPEAAREWVRYAAQAGADCIKYVSYEPSIMAALLDEGNKLHLGSTAHLEQTGVAQMNAADAVRLGLGTVTHFYGLFEAMYDNNSVQPYPIEYNYNDEQWRFGQVARQWNLVTPGSKKWNDLLMLFREHDVTLDPTLTIYMAGRNIMYRRLAEWHAAYTLPSLMDFYTPSRANHGSFFFDWTTSDEVAWKKFYERWMQFLLEYMHMGGRVTPSTDAGFIYSTYGFAYIEELEALQEAGFHPLEVIRAATLHAATELHRYKGAPIEFGVLRPGLLADIVIVPENPVHNFKVLYGTGHLKLNDSTGVMDRVGGVRWTIKDGIVYDARQLLADVAVMVEKQKQARGAK